MRLIAIEICGYRGYATNTRLSFDDLTVLVGRNDGGKSTIFEALDLFLSGGKPDPSDFSVGGNGHMSIVCTFSNLPPEVVLDSKTNTVLEDEYLLDASGHLQIKKTYRGAKPPEISALALHPLTEASQSLLGLKLDQLKRLATELGIPEPDGDKRSSTTFRRAIWQRWKESGTSMRELVEVPLSAEDGKQVASALEGYYPLFHLFKADREGSESDSLAQDPAKAIVKSVLDRHSEDLSRLTATITEEVRSLLGDVVDRLSEVASPLASTLAPKDIEPAWYKAFSALRFVDENDVPLSKRGSGTRRLVLLSFFRAEAERTISENSAWHRGVIIAVEEPETALHPDLQRESVGALSQVAELPHRQVLMTTHSSNLVRHLPLDSVRFVSQTGGAREWSSTNTTSDKNLLLQLDQTLGIFTDHNVKLFIVVEGRNDIDGLITLSTALSNHGTADVADLGMLDSAGEVCFIPIGGCGAAALWESRLSPFKRPEIHILDSDKTSEHAPLKRNVQAYKEQFESPDLDTRVEVLNRRELENYLTIESVVEQYAAEFAPFEAAFRSMTEDLDWMFADIPNLVAQAVHTCNSETPWQDLKPEVQSKKEGRAKKRLIECFRHPSVIADLTQQSGNDVVNLLKDIASTVGAVTR